MSRVKSESERQGHNTPARLAGSPIRKPATPIGLGLAGRKVWHKLWALGIPYQESDVWVITRYCKLHDRHQDLENLLRRDGLTVEGSQKQPVMHYALRAISEVEKQMDKLEAVLVLTPDARARIKLEAGGSDDLDDFDSEFSDDLSGLE